MSAPAYHAPLSIRLLALLTLILLALGAGSASADVLNPREDAGGGGGGGAAQVPVLVGSTGEREEVAQEPETPVLVGSTGEREEVARGSETALDAGDQLDETTRSASLIALSPAPAVEFAEAPGLAPR